MGASALGFRNIIGRFYAKLEELTASQWDRQLSVYVPSDQESETYKWLGMTPALREWVGGREAKGFRENGITIANKKFEATIEVLVDEIRRDKTGQIQVRIDEMAGRVAEHWSKLLTTLIADNGACYDSADFFSASHSEGTSGTQKNLLTATEAPGLNVTTTTAPTAEEMVAAITDVIQYMRAYLDDQGEPMNASANSWLIMTPWNLWGATEKAVRAELVAAGSGAQTNVLKAIPKLTIDVVSNPRLSSAASAVWYMFRTDASMKPFIMQEELFQAGSKDDVFENDRYLVGVKALRNVGYAYWQYAAHCTLS